MEYDAEEPEKSPLKQLWEESWDFEYWDNRIDKLDPSNEADKLEALFTYFQIVDTYVHIFCAKVRNPLGPWFMVTERTYPSHIQDTLEKFEIDRNGETSIELRTFDADPEIITGTDIGPEWKEENRPIDFFASDFLGCPAEIDPESHTIQFQENPDAYIEIINETLNAWQNKRGILNDLKHGFRLLPFSWETTERFLADELFRPEAIDLEAKKQEFEESQDEHIYFWRLEISNPDEREMPEPLQEKDDLYVGGDIVVYRVEFQTCIELSRITLLLLENLFGRGGDNHVVDRFRELESTEGQGVPLTESFFTGSLFMCK